MHVVRGEGSLADHDRCDLCDLADVVIGLHDALYPRDGEVDCDVDAVGARRRRVWGAYGAIALSPLASGLVGDVRHVLGVCILHAFLVARAPRHGRRGKLGRCELLGRCKQWGVESRWVVGLAGRAAEGRREGDVGDGASVALVLGMHRLVVGGVVAREVGGLGGPGGVSSVHQLVHARAGRLIGHGGEGAGGGRKS